MRMERPPQLGPDERPSPEGFSLLALRLLRKMARDDPGLAHRLHEAGIELGGAAPMRWRG
jgi:hypothetical protein